MQITTHLAESPGLVTNEVEKAGPSAALSEGIQYVDIGEDSGSPIIETSRSDTPKQNLCAQCSKLSIKTLFSGPYSPKNDQHILKSLQALWDEQECVFCDLIKKQLGNCYGAKYLEMKIQEGHYEDVVLGRSPLDVSFGHFDRTVIDNVACYVEVDFLTPFHLVGKQSRLVGEHGLGDEVEWRMPSLFSIQSPAHEPCQDIHGLPVDGDRVNWELAKQWLTACFECHKDDGVGAVADDDYRSHLRVIDVDKACVVPCPPDAAYVALSYQWGADQKLKLLKGNVKKMETPGFFNTTEGDPARTIRDTLIATKGLGYRYAWIDALCIIQDDMENVIENVDRMDKVYQGAALTIVAAAGQNAYHGLPGISLPRSECQLRLNVDGITISTMLQKGNRAINSTRWNTRGWTYQERLLSKRLLTFTDSQIFYQCSHGCELEEQFKFSPNGDDGQAVDYTFLDPLARLDLKEQNLWDVYAIAVLEYSKRSLTDPGDKLRAITGILNFLKHPFGAPFYFGLPTAVFDVALLWKPFGACHRGSPTFPSWSWVGWESGVVYNLPDSLNNMCECTISVADIRPRNLEFPLCSSSGSCPEVPSGWIRKFDEDELAIEYESQDPQRKQFIYPRPVSFVDELHGKIPFESSVLSISAAVAEFWLTDQHSNLSDPLVRMKEPCKDGKHTICYLSILNDERQMVGTIIIDGSVLPDVINKKHKFLALSRSTLDRIDEDPSWDEETKTFQHWSKQPQPQTQPSQELPHDAVGDEVFTQRSMSSFLKENYERTNRDFFDKRFFSEHTFWPAVNVLLISAERDGVVERLGVGRIHVDAFMVLSSDEHVLLG